MKIPKRIKVGAHTFEVISGYNFKNKNVVGMCAVNEDKILLSDKTNRGNPLAPVALQSTFFHEMLHAIDAIYNGSTLKEQEVCSLCEGLLQVLTDSGLLKK